MFTDNVSLSIHLTLSQVINMLRVISQREPDRIGQAEGGSCVYASVEQGFALTPVCIVGQMFADLGLLRLLTINPNDLDYNGFLGACSVEGDFWTSLARYGVTADTDAQQFASNVQSKQDRGITWGLAFDGAVQEYREEQERLLTERLDSLFL